MTTALKRRRDRARGYALRHDYAKVDDFTAAVRRGDVPIKGLVSPGWVANEAGVTRQSVHKAIGAGRIESWHIKGGYVFVLSSAVEAFDSVENRGG